MTNLTDITHSTLEIKGEELSTIFIKGKPYRERCEILVIQDYPHIPEAKIYLWIYAEGKYRIPGGGMRPDESIIEGAIRECREESRICVTDVQNSDILCIRNMSDILKTGVLRKKPSGDVNYAGSITHITIGKYLKKFQGHINNRDKDTEMVRNGKFYDIDEVKGILIPEHTEALIKYGYIKKRGV